jgi:hypothetical protein
VFDPKERLSAESYRKLRGAGKLIKETEWMRVYELGSKSLRYESKFLTDELQISAESFASRWSNMTSAERHGFALAYSAKVEFTSDDEQIVNLIMEDGDERVWNCLATFVVIRHPQRDRVLSFIRDKLEKNPDNPDNYIQALGIAKDLFATPILLPYYEEYRKAAQAVPQREHASAKDVWPIAKYLGCSRALWKITGSEAYADQIRGYLKHPDSQVRWWAEHALTDDRK